MLSVDSAVILFGQKIIFFLNSDQLLQMIRKWSESQKNLLRTLRRKPKELCYFMQYSNAHFHTPVNFLGLNTYLVLKISALIISYPYSHVHISYLLFHVHIFKEIIGSVFLFFYDQRICHEY